MIDRLLDWRDGLGRVLMALAGCAAGFAMIEALVMQGEVPPAGQWIALWRAFGYGVFAALFLLLAIRPRRSAGVWEVSFLHKAALGVAALFMPAIPEAASAGPVDAGLAAATLAAWLLTRGWRSWQA